MPPTRSARSCLDYGSPSKLRDLPFNSDGGLRSAICNPTSAIRVCAVVVSLAQTSLPPLPRLVFESFPASTREGLLQVYKEATARPTDAEAVGALARTLHAWEQWDAAHEAYARAQALAPRTFA